MRKLMKFVLVCTVVSLVAVGAFSFATAQDTTTSAGSVQCDQDLVLNLYVADRFFGFQNVRDQLTAGGADTSSMVDLNNINKGQFQPWFDSAMAMSGTGATGTNSTGATGTSSGLGLNDQQTGAITSTLMMDDASRQAMMDSANSAAGVDSTTLTQLPSASIAGEAPECTQLRTELNRFWTTVAFSDYSGALSGMGTGATTGTGATGSTDMGTGATGSTDSGTSGTTDMSATATPAA